MLRPLEQPDTLHVLVAACRDAFEIMTPSVAAPAEPYRLEMPLVSVPDGDLKSVKRALIAAFAPMASDQFEIGAVSLLRQADTSERFRVVERWRLSGK